MIGNEIGMESVLTLPAGKYYIGDPFYAVDSSIALEDFPVTTVDDGVYYSNQDDRVYVDSGTFGIVPLEFIKEHSTRSEAELEKFGKIVEFQDEFEVVIDQTAENEPTHNFGGIKFYTNGDPRFDFDEEEYEEEFYDA